MTKRSFFPTAIALAVLLLPGALAAQAEEPRPLTPEDIHRVLNVGGMAISPDGEWVAYTVSTTQIDKDSRSSNLHMVSWDGETHLQLTYAEGGEGSAQFSPDGKYIAFIAGRDDDADGPEDPKGKSQVWLLNRSGGEAQRLTEIEGGVSSFEFSPDSTRLVLVSKDPEPKDEEEDEAETEIEAKSKKKGKSDTPDPIVVDRYQFKRDREGYLNSRYRRIYLFDIETRASTLLTPGEFDSGDPHWSPDGTRIVFTSKRAGDPDRHDNSDIYLIEAREGAEAIQLTTWDGPDSSPAFSPDGTRIAYLQDGPAKYAGYDPSQLAVISVEGGTPTFPTPNLDRATSRPRWSPDGSKLYFLYADDRVRSVAAVSPEGGEISRLFPAPEAAPGVARSFEVGARGLAVLASFPTRPTEIFRVEDGVALTDHNRELVDEIEWATVEGFDSVGKDGVAVGSMLLKPPGYQPGTPYPTIAYVHGGPVGQDGFEFDITSQVLAAQGYLVVNPNYRGSNGRGRDFARAIYADWGNLEIQDIHAVMDNLVEQGLADPDRLGIGGWSYGGMNTNYAIASDTRFSAAVSGAAISNMITGYGTDQYIRQYENEIGLPWEGLDTYLKISYPFFHADRIKTPTLFMCGEKDFNVPLINSEQMYQAVKSLGVPTQLVIYPGQFHGLSKPSYSQDRLERMIEWYGKYLSPDS
jgi:dipeptidyl aminopeptidase/acylaminoacyl peptidase